MSAVESWQKDGYTFHELVQQPYENCTFAAGIVEGHPVDTVYLRWERDDKTGGMLMLRPDELAAIAHVATGALWSHLIAQMDINNDKKQDE